MGRSIQPSGWALCVTVHWTFTVRRTSMKSHRTVLSLVLPLVLSLVTVALLLTAAATAQTFTPLYTYPNTSNNSTGVNAPALCSQGPDGELYSTIHTIWRCGPRDRWQSRRNHSGRRRLR